MSGPIIRREFDDGIAHLGSPIGLTALRWAIGVVIVLGLLGCVTKGANNPADPYFASTGNRTPLAGFGETKVTVENAGSFLEWCLLLAANDAQRAQGLMRVTDSKLGGYDGMLFHFHDDVQENFWMRNTPMPLSIAYVNKDGAIVSTADMAPCGDSPDCPNYPPAGPYRFTIEVPQGKLADLGIVEGAKITDAEAPCS
ncbi:MAG TPA: DUF192 domain-containing protein [Acidimicrobiales bacterium]|nr:DUF192 domain-containing protein [Acidimicrobiales bacterium]